ncbi:hypothetical protein DPMN_070283 [Dreissena polymorpha]|uniref:Uncharacterized protein n=1 Tax=Dreissena polymorpha TaxID=45954 RepID=A0A9D3Z107_DREPO|nr:hypothetical protein DPMN_070283 [Dreissena polymorpha]
MMRCTQLQMSCISRVATFQISRVPLEAACTRFLTPSCYSASTCPWLSSLVKT